MEVLAAAQHLAHLIGRPALDLAAEVLADQARQREVFIRIVGLRHLEPSGHRRHARHGGLANGRAHIIEAGNRQRPERPRMVEADASDHRVH
jgi:hypothetical protein